MDHTKMIRYGFAGLLIASAAAINGSLISARAQNGETKAPVAKRPSEGGRDPFRKYEPIVRGKKSNLVSPPSVEARIAQYRAQKLAAMNARIAPPKPTAALLISELEVIGISRSPRGYVAIVEAMPIKLSYVIH